MAGKPKYKNPPATPMNQWVRDALAAAGLSQQELGDALTRAGIGNYDRSMIQKMTVARRVTMDEAQAIAAVTNHPLPENGLESQLPREYFLLSEDHRKAVNTLIRGLLADQQADK